MIFKSDNTTKEVIYENEKIYANAHAAAEYTYESGKLTYSYTEENGEGTLMISGTGTITQKSYQDFEAYLKSQEYYDYVLTKLVIGEGITTIGKSTFSSMYDSDLIEVVFPEGLKKIDTSAFSSCNSMKSPKFPESLTYIGNGAFALCTAITDVTFPSNLRYLGDGCFGYTGLKEITIPASVVNYMKDVPVVVRGDLIESITFETNGDFSIGNFTDWCPNLKKVTLGTDIYTYDPLTKA